MKWSLSLGRVAGIRIQVHPTFVLILAWAAWVYFQRAHTAAAAAEGVLFTLVLFGAVVLHELGHALVARRFGIRTLDITLLPIGGVSRLERIPERPREELWVSVAGPAVNLLLAIGTLLVARLVGARLDLASADVLGGSILGRFLWTNVGLAAFNLLPAFPLDGGRALRALLAMRTDYAAATRTAAVVGRFFALLVGALGLVANPFLILIAIFIWQGGSAEAQRTEQRIALRGITVRQAMISRFASLAPDDHLGHAADGILAGFQEDFPVLEDGRVVGLLPRADLVRALARFGPHAPVSIGMRTEFPSAEASEPLEGVVARMGESATGSVPVLDSGRLVGMLTLENVGELLMIRRAEREARALAAT